MEERMKQGTRILIAAASFMLLAGLVPGAQATVAVVQQDVRLVKNVPGSTGGHSAVEGNRLYVGAYGLGMTIFDITNPADPQKIGEYKPALGQAGFFPSAGDPGGRADTVPDAAVFDGRHIAALNGTGRAQGTQQTEFLDVTNPAEPVLLHRFTGSTDGESHNGDIVDPRRLWLPSGGGGNNFVRIYDMEPLLQSPPAAPAKIFSGNIQTMWLNSPYRLKLGKPTGPVPTHIHDLEVYTDHRVLLLPDEWQDQDGDGTPDPTYEDRDLAFYAASQGYPLTVGAGTAQPNSAVYIVDITDPAGPVVMNKVPARIGHRYLHEVQLLEGDPSIMFTSDEDLHNGCDAGGVYSWRLSEDLMDATYLDDWYNGTDTPAPVCSAHVFSSHGNYVFMGSYNAGLQVIDFTDPADLKRAGQYIAPGANSWGALYNKGYVYAGDFGARGLDVFEFIPNPAAQALLKVNNPGTRTATGVAEAGCEVLQDPFGPTNGTDGLIVAIPPDKRDGTHKIRAVGSSSGAPYDLDIWFHDEACVGLGVSHATDSPDEFGPIPEGAAFASVDLYTGPPTYVYVQIDP
jgi:hypothetical protein